MGDFSDLLHNGDTAVHGPSGLVVTIGHVSDGSARCRFPRGSTISIRTDFLKRVLGVRKAA